MDYRGTVLPTKLKFKMQACFCLMSILPILAGLYVASLFIHYPFNGTAHLATVSLVCLFSLALSLLGFHVAKQMVLPIQQVSAVAHQIADGKLEGVVSPVTDTTDEIEDLTRSLKIISLNAKELLEKVEKLSLKDRLTGLYNATYIRERLDEEIQRAIHYQRPCSFAYLFIQNYDACVTKNGSGAMEEAMKLVGQVFNSHTREFDRAARISQNELVVIFPDQNKKKCIEVMDRILQKITAIPIADEKEQRLTAFVGISENPIDGVQADGLFIKAQGRAKMAGQAGKLLEAFA